VQYKSVLSRKTSWKMPPFHSIAAQNLTLVKDYSEQFEWQRIRKHKQNSLLKGLTASAYSKTRYALVADVRYRSLNNKLGRGTGKFSL
jgi:hypothetical protein